ncbi:MAG: Type 1 glutamine amidotransferase-like domain-containing protein [Candidatus Nanopelagicales bacterium]|jgi:cyanophycinase
MHDVEAWLLEGRPARYVQLATAASLEGEASLRRWHDLGAQAAQRLGVEQIVLDVRVRDDAFDPAHIAAVTGAGLVYLSGGNPQHLARTLIGTPLWQAIHAAWRSGASLAGCSAGAMALGGYVPDIRHPRQGGQDGLGLVPSLRVLPHFDVYAKWIPDVVMRPLLTEGSTVVGIDEQTSLQAEPPEDPMQPWQFRGVGRGSCWRIEADRKYRVNSPLALEVAVN